MTETTIVTPDQIEMRPVRRRNIKGLMVIHVNAGAPYITFLESAPHHYAHVHSLSDVEAMMGVKCLMRFNGRWCDVGSLTFVPAHEEYWYSTGDEACRVALIRPKGRGTFENGREDIAGDPAKPDSANSAKPNSANGSAND